MMDAYTEKKKKQKQTTNPAAENQTNNLPMLKFNPGDFIFNFILKSLAASASV